jgi:hypothetical protein
MAQSLEVNIKTTSDVPQAMDKAKAATTGFGAQIEGIGKKFGSSFKDIFLSFLGPMAILTTVLGLIGKMIADNQRKTQEAHQAALDNTNELMSAQDRFYANKREKEKLTEEQIKQAKLERENVTVEFLRNDPRGNEIINKFQPPKMGGFAGEYEFTNPTASILSKSKTIQDQVQALIAADMAKNPEAKALTGPTSFKTPEGFGNIVGVGANPVMEAMTMQLEESRKQTALLESLNSKSPGGGVPTDFTKSPIPSRASMLQGSK